MQEPKKSEEFNKQVEKAWREEIDRELAAKVEAIRNAHTDAMQQPYTDSL